MDADGKEFSDLLEEELYAELLKLPLGLILTTRTGTDRIIPVEEMPLKNLYEIFRNHGLNIAEEKMDDLIRAVERHTMAVDIIARTLKHNRALTPDELLRRFHDGTLPIQNYRPVGSDRDPKQLRIYEHMARLFRVAALSGEEQSVQRWAVLLGEDGMDFGLFCEAIPEELRQLPDALVERGWLGCKAEESGNRITIHPIIRLVCRGD